MVLAFNVNGRKTEKYYVIGVTLIGLGTNLASYVSGNLGCISFYTRPRKPMNSDLVLVQMGRHQRNMLVPHRGSNGTAALVYGQSSCLDPACLHRGGCRFYDHCLVPCRVSGAPSLVSIFVPPTLIHTDSSLPRTFRLYILPQPPIGPVRRF